jgi:serine/threonine protein kinase
MEELGRLVGRYKLYEKLASGGMATIHLGCAVGAVGFTRAVVIKRLHKEYAADREFVSMFVDEARLASRIRHPNVIPMLDVVSESGELFLVMEYVHGEALGRLIAKRAAADTAIAADIASAIGIGLLEGLHAAHEATSDKGEALGIVHRDVSPQNVLVGLDGVTRVFDFGIAKAETRIHETNAGGLKGKMAYMSPEQIKGDPTDRRTDVWAAAVVLWEAVTRRRLFVADGSTEYLAKITAEAIPPPSRYADVPPAFDAAILKALERDKAERYATAREFAVALEAAVPPANPRDVGAWVEQTSGEALAHRAELVKSVEGSTTDANSIRRQIAVLELENAPTQVTPSNARLPRSRVATSEPSAAKDASEMVTRTETSAGVVVATGAPTPSTPPLASLPPPASARSGRLVAPALALLVGLGAGGAVVWTRVIAPAKTEAASTQPTASASAPGVLVAPSSTASASASASSALATATPTPSASSESPATASANASTTAPPPAAATASVRMGTRPHHPRDPGVTPATGVTATAPPSSSRGLELDIRK